MPQTDQSHSQSKGANKEGLRALHVLVPAEAHLQARRAALESRMPFKVYMGHLMSAARPISIDVVATPVAEVAPEVIPTQAQAVKVTATSGPLTDPAEPHIEPSPPEPQTADPECAVDDGFDLFR